MMQEESLVDDEGNEGCDTLSTNNSSPAPAAVAEGNSPSPSAAAEAGARSMPRGHEAAEVSPTPEGLVGVKSVHASAYRVVLAPGVLSCNVESCRQN